jgi:hypothetical protein
VVVRAEAGAAVTRVNARVLRETLEAAGIRFLDAGGVTLERPER